jgi:hypothetical protein
MIRFQAEWQKESFLIYFQTPLSIDFSGGEYRITDSQTPPNRYRILRYWDAARIDRLACATAVRITEGVEFFEGGTPPQPLPAPSFPQL